MAKTDVILTHNVVGLGSESDQVQVAAGFARNYLYPQRLAIPLTAANKRQIAALQKRRTEREARELHTMSDLASTLSKLTLLISVKTGEDGKMFGSVTAGTIADELRHQYDATVEKRKIHLPHAIKALGEHDVELRLHHDVACTLKVRVNSTTPLSPEVEASLKEQASREKANRDGAAAAAKGAKKDGKEAGPEKKAERKPRAPKAEKAEKPEKADKAEKPEKAEQGDKAAKA